MVGISTTLEVVELAEEDLLNVEVSGMEGEDKGNLILVLEGKGKAEFLAEHRTVLESRLAPVCREITDSRARTRDELECLYRKIVSYMLLHSGLGSPTEIGLVGKLMLDVITISVKHVDGGLKEQHVDDKKCPKYGVLESALQSVFPQVELGTFLALTKKDKERQLNELSMIVTGIRLFNKNCKKGGEGIDDLPAILNEAVPATKQNVESELQATQQLIYHYTAIIERLEKSRAQWYEEDGFHDKLKEALYNVRQHEVFLHIIVVKCSISGIYELAPQDPYIPLGFPEFCHLMNIPFSPSSFPGNNQLSAKPWIVELLGTNLNKKHCIALHKKASDTRPWSVQLARHPQPSVRFHECYDFDKNLVH
eukprot:g45162.t1